jgi:hypothetical protein
MINLFATKIIKCVFFYIEGAFEILVYSTTGYTLSKIF